MSVHRHFLCTLLILCILPTVFGREFTVMTYNLKQFALMDRDRDGKKDNPKPDAECRAIAQILGEVHPDVLAVQEIGDPAWLNTFQAWLKTEGIDYGHVAYLQRGDRDINLAILSVFPIIGNTHHTNEWYSIGKAKLPVARGFLEAEIQVSETYSFHLINAHLKSKVYNPLGQTEMRRNEARLLNKVVRRLMEDQPDAHLLVVGDMNDNPNSAAIREVMGKTRKNLFDLRPQEPAGDAWTYYNAPSELHTRFDYIFSNARMLDRAVPEKSTVIRHPLTYAASDHRPVMATFTTD